MHFGEVRMLVIFTGVPLSEQIEFLFIRNIFFVGIL